mmetsp:Transcript_129192/g.288028  ORF Transcript_129192/g.288028 Transcript_129192/m.288028 type:complete len:81 (+) Transcript_129192:1099-1341(+)
MCNCKPTKTSSLNFRWEVGNCAVSKQSCRTTRVMVVVTLALPWQYPHLRMVAPGYGYCGIYIGAVVWDFGCPPRGDLPVT